MSGMCVRSADGAPRADRSGHWVPRLEAWASRFLARHLTRLAGDTMHYLVTLLLVRFANEEMDICNYINHILSVEMDLARSIACFILHLTRLHQVSTGAFEQCELPKD